jgi:CheY-like chemotaxis protein
MERSAAAELPDLIIMDVMMWMEWKRETLENLS